MLNMFSQAPVAEFSKEIAAKLQKRYSPAVDQQANRTDKKINGFGHKSKRNKILR
jgi:hypothetical protein